MVGPSDLNAGCFYYILTCPKKNGKLHIHPESYLAKKEKPDMTKKVKRYCWECMNFQKCLAGETLQDADICREFVFETIPEMKKLNRLRLSAKKRQIKPLQ